MSDCTARIRPLPVPTEIACEKTGDIHAEHQAVLRDYAYPGSETIITWQDDDRRCYHGDWPGACGHRERLTTGGLMRDECILPKGHRGNHAS